MPWAPADGATARRLEREALKEIGTGHELYGIRLRAVARCTACDDVVFSLPSGGWAIVHLTWAATKPEKAPMPRTTLLGGFLAIELAMDQHMH
jgi:hypothetical protein